VRGAWGWVWAVAAVVGLAVVVNAAPWIAAPPGDSHDGRNAGTWALGARGLVEDPIGSRLGTDRPDGSAYANHPPAVVAEAAVALAATRDHPLGLRLPGLAASLASLALLVVLLRELGFRPIAAATGIVLAGSSAMFLTYATMLDTPVLALPFALATLLVGTRIQRGQPVRTGLVALLGTGVGLTSWQGTFLVGIVVAVLVVAAPDRRAVLAPCSALAGGAAAGVLLTLTWAWWGYGSLGDLWSALRDRTASDVPWLEVQRSFVGDLYGPVLVLVVLAGAVVAVARRRHRLVLGCSLAAVAGWTRLMGQAASIHDYWTYLGVAVVALAGATVAEAVEDAAAARQPAGGPRSRLVDAGVVLVVGLIGVASFIRTSDAERAIAGGVDGGRLAASLPTAAAPGDEVLTTSDAFMTSGGVWAEWIGHGTAPRVDASALAALIEDDPQHPVLIVLPRGRVPSDLLQDQAVARVGRYYLVPALLLEDLVDEPMVLPASLVAD